MITIDKKRLGCSFFVVLLFILVLACYFNSMQNDFVWDDNTIIVRNDTIKDISNFGDIIFAEDTTEDMEHTGFYRPLTYFSYAVDYYLWGLNPVGFRAVNIFFHFFTALIIYHLAMLLFRDRAVSFSAAALFAVHPVHVESVSFIAARGSELSGFYYLLSFFFFVKYRRASRATAAGTGHESAGGVKRLYLTYRYLFFSSIAFIISFMSKEYAITLFFVMLSYDHLVHSRAAARVTERVSSLFAYLPYIALTVAYFIARKIATRGTHGILVLTDDAMTQGLLLRMVDAVRIVARSAGLLIYPHGLSLEYAFKPTETLFSVGLLLVIAAFIVTVYFAYSMFKNNKPVFVSFVLFLSPLALTVGLIPIKGEAHLADRWLYISAAGFFMMAAYLLSVLTRKVSPAHSERLLAIIVFVIVAIYSYGTVERNRVFADELSLWSDTVMKSPDSFKAHLNRGYALYTKGAEDEGLAEYNRALEIKPGHSKAHYNVAVYYHNKGDYKRAIEEYESIIESGTPFFDVYFNLAECYERSGDAIEALVNYKRALGLNGESVNLLKRLSNLYKNLKDHESASKYRVMYERLLESK